MKDIRDMEGKIIDTRMNDLRIYEGRCPTLRAQRDGVLYIKNYSEFLIIFSLVGKCRFSLIFQAIPAFLLTEDTRHNPAFSSLTRQSKVVKV